MLDAAKRAEELLNEMKKNQFRNRESYSSSEEEKANITDVSEPDDAKILQNLETFIGLVRNIDLSGKKNFLKVVKVAM